MVNLFSFLFIYFYLNDHDDTILLTTYFTLYRKEAALTLISLFMNQCNMTLYGLSFNPTIIQIDTFIYSSVDVELRIETFFSSISITLLHLIQMFKHFSFR